MPTPMPIIAVTCGANDGTSSTRARSVTTASPIPMPNSAVMIGRPIASSEPNAISRMKTAASMPIASLAGCVWSVNIVPAELDLQRVGSSRPSTIDAHVRREIDRHVVGLHVEQDLGVGDLAVLRR